MLPSSGSDTPTALSGQLFTDDKGWGALAVELRVRILLGLDATDLLSCSKVRTMPSAFLLRVRTPGRKSPGCSCIQETD